MFSPHLLAHPCSAGDRVFDAELHQHGAVLWRGTPLVSEADFGRWMADCGSELLEYDYRSTPRTRVLDRVYTATEYPGHQRILMHNENAYTRQWPRRLWFFCARPADKGGATPLCDSREVYRRIDPAIRRRFERHGVLYVRNYNTGLDLQWQTVFGTDDRGELERRCLELGLEHEWRGGDRLMTRQRCQAVTRHPVTGEAVWFNQAHLFHVSSLEPDIRDTLLSVFEEEYLPRNAYYGDGSAIESTVLDEIRDVYQDLSTEFPWQAGDVLVVDNVLVAHGRAPFEGERRVFVAMTDAAMDPSESERAARSEP